MSEQISEPISERPTTSTKPFSRLQQYLIEMKVSAVLLRELLVELKEVIILVGLIAFTVCGMVALFLKLYR